MILQVLDSTSPLLKQTIVDIDPKDTKIQQIVENLKETMIEKQALGIAAIQVGIPYNIMLVGNPFDSDGILTFINPKIVSYNGKNAYQEEGCLTFPNLVVKIKRPETVRLRFTMLDGRTETQNFVGMTSRLIQHHVDILNGIPFTKRANRYHLTRAKKLVKK